jgi:hypothetical protein
MNVPAEAAIEENTPMISVPAGMDTAVGKLVMLQVTAENVHAVRHCNFQKSPVTAAVEVLAFPPYSPPS